MDRLVDLDAAAQEIESRRTTWEQAGFTVGQKTWHDFTAPWPQTLHTDRAAVEDPDSVGIRLDHDGGPALEIVLFTGGWADVTAIDFQIHELVALDGGDITTPAAFGDLLDQAFSFVHRSLQRRDDTG
ncbi:hypothetical protein [Allokutzneria oryzae]|uniref:Uncharacterized protein n=1 Tax=Allokutzneria oryzae TaxID=1378989 RepID=A0ABV5ZW25_9PSEU